MARRYFYDDGRTQEKCPSPGCTSFLAWGWVKPHKTSSATPLLALVCENPKCAYVKGKTQRGRYSGYTPRIHYAVAARRF